MKKYENVPLESQVPQYVRWVKSLEPGQVANVYFLPWIGMVYRTAQFVEYVGKVNLIDMQDVDGEGIDLTCELPKKGKVVLLMRSVLLSPDGLRIAREIEKWLVNFEGGVVIIHEFAPVQILVRNDWPSWVMANQVIYEMAGKGVVVDYIQNVSREMKIKFDQDEVDDIAEACGGWLWLVKDVLRSKAERPTEKVRKLMIGESFVQKMKLIWGSWPEPYKKAVLGIKNDENILVEMRNIGVINESNKVVGSELSRFIQAQKMEELVVTNEYVEYKGKDITEKFKIGERKVLAHLWKNKDVTGRDEVAKLFWDDDKDNEITDWALDQKMKRLRAKLAKLGLPIVIVTKKGEGYGISQD